MKGRLENEPLEAPLTPAQAAADRELEALVNEALASCAADPLPSAFTARVMAARPFAPWEVKRPSAWRGPALVFGALLLASAGAFVLPLLRLGPGSAAVLWVWATLAAFSRPIAALASALGVLTEAGAALRHSIPAGTAAALGVTSLASVGAGSLVLRRLRRQSARAARS